MDRMTERSGRNIGLRIEIKDRLLAEAIHQVIMVRYKGVSVSAGADPASVFVLRDAPGGMVLLRDDEGRTGGVLAYFRYGDRAGRLVERLYELTGTEYRERGTLDRGSEAECVAFIASKGGIGTTTLARNFGRLVFRDLGKRCLYLSLAPYGHGRDGMAGNALTRLYYRLMSGSAPEISGLCLEEQGLFTLENRGLNRESGSLSSELLRKLLSAAGASGFGYVLLDMGNHLEKDRIELLKECGMCISVYSGEEGPVRAFCGGRAAYVQSRCAPGPVPPRRAGCESLGADVLPGKAIRICEAEAMDPDSPPPEYCEDVRRVMEVLGVGYGCGKEKKRGGESRESGLGQDPCRRR